MLEGEGQMSGVPHLTGQQEITDCSEPSGLKTFTQSVFFCASKSKLIFARRKVKNS